MTTELVQVIAISRQVGIDDIASPNNVLWSLLFNPSLDTEMPDAEPEAPKPQLTEEEKKKKLEELEELR